MNKDTTSQADGPRLDGMVRPLVKWQTKEWRHTEIERIECVRETAQTVWVLEHRWGDKSGPSLERMRRKGDDVHDTWEAAHAYLLQRAEKKLDAARRATLSAQADVDLLSGLSKPQEA